MKRRDFHQLVVRITKAKLVLALLTTLIWGGLPATACVCTDGTVKPFCTKICGGGKCCCGDESRSRSCCECSHSRARSTCCASTFSNKSTQQVAASKPCGCHRVAKDSATLLSRSTSAEDDSESMAAAFCVQTKIRETTLGSQSWSIRSHEKTRRPNDIPILLCHLTI